MKLVPPDLDPQKLAEALLEMGGSVAVHSAYQFAGLLRREGHPDAAAYWHDIAEIMNEIMAGKS